MPARLLGKIDAAAALAELRDREVNYTPNEVGPSGWHFDVHRAVVGYEPVGLPEPGGVWETACGLVRDYEFTPPELIRAVYHRRDPLLGRDLLLEGRFWGLRFYLGVRITTLVDEVRDGRERVWGWAYQTLEHHLERGQVTYEIIKCLRSGRVEFVARGHSQRSPALGPILRLGWLMFGRRTQLRFYRRCGQRMAQLVYAAPSGAPVRDAKRTQLPSGDLVLAPSGVQPHPLDRFTVRQHNRAR